MLFAGLSHYCSTYWPALKYNACFIIFIHSCVADVYISSVQMILKIWSQAKIVICQNFKICKWKLAQAVLVWVWFKYLSVSLHCQHHLQLSLLPKVLTYCILLKAKCKKYDLPLCPPASTPLMEDMTDFKAIGSTVGAHFAIPRTSELLPNILFHADSCQNRQKVWSQNCFSRK